MTKIPGGACLMDIWLHFTQTNFKICQHRQDWIYITVNRRADKTTHFNKYSQMSQAQHQYGYIFQKGISFQRSQKLFKSERKIIEISFM